MSVKWEPWEGLMGTEHRVTVGDLTLHVREHFMSGTGPDGEPWSESRGFGWSAYWDLVHGYIVDGGPNAIGRTDWRRASTRAEAQRVCVEETVAALLKMQEHARLVIEIGGELLEALRGLADTSAEDA